MAINNTTPAVTDFSHFGALRAAADRHDPKALQQAAKQFEALFTEMLLKTARETKIGDDLTGEQGDFYKDLFDQQMSVHLASGKGLGLADMLVRQLGGTQHPAAATAASTASSGLNSLNGAAPAAAPSADTTTPATGSSEPTADINDPSWQPKSREDFVAAILPHAQKAAAELGVPTRALMAQAALETGWGQKIGKQSDGGNSFNLFNIKAGGSWNGASSVQATSEYGNGAWKHEDAAFRSYPSIGAAFDDYVKFLRNNPRYANALNCGDIQGFAHGLQKAGYATDPQYAQKIVGVACSAEMSTAIGATQFVNA
jgi:flagellar protein FlgJ